MSNPYQIPPSAFQDDPSSNLPTGLPGFGLRRSSYASVASGSGAFARATANFVQVLNPAANADDSDSNSSLRAPYAADPDVSLRGGAGSGGGLDASDSLMSLINSRSVQLPSFSRAFEPFLRGPVHSDGYGPAPSNNGFFTPSYLSESVYVQKLEDQYKAKMQSMCDSQQILPSHHHHQLHSLPPKGVAGMPSAVAVAAGAVIGGNNLAASSSFAGVGLNSHSSSSHSLGSGIGATTSSSLSKLGAPSYRGVGYDVVERVASGGPGGDEAMAPLPTRWDRKDKPAGLDVLSDGLDVKYTTPKITGEREPEACSIRADHYMPPQCGIYYFEVTILSKRRDESTIGIGFSDASASLSRPPGWEPKSWGYHSDDGHTFYAHSTGKQYGPTYSSSDIIGCGVNFRTGTAFYTKNGDHLGIAFREIKGSNLKLFPTVGLKKAGEHIRANFGQVPFAFDIVGMMKKERLAINRQIMETNTDSLAPPLKETELIQQLVLQFLQHDGYIETARAFAEEVQVQKEALNLDPKKEIKGVNITDDEDANNRQRIRRAVLEGDIDQALKLTNAYYPHVLEINETVYFRLRCRKFIEMIRREAELNFVGGGEAKQSNGHGRNSSRPGPLDSDTDDIDMVGDGSTDGHPESQYIIDEAIVYGKNLQSEYANDPRSEIRSALSEIFSLMAYSNPLKEKEVAHLMDQKGRVVVAEELNAAILRSFGKSSRAALENLYAQTSVLLDDLRQDGGPGSFVAIQSVVEQIPKSPAAF